jgi:hypothetical protein
MNNTGSLNTATYIIRAQLHRPSDPEALATEIRRLHSTGLTRRDIASALRLQTDQVVNALAAVSDG